MLLMKNILKLQFIYLLYITAFFGRWNQSSGSQFFKSPKCSLSSSSTLPILIDAKPSQLQKVKYFITSKSLNGFTFIERTITRYIIWKQDEMGFNCSATHLRLLYLFYSPLAPKIIAHMCPTKFTQIYISPWFLLIFLFSLIAMAWT